MSILIDVPQIAYKTWSLQFVIKGEDGKRDHEKEREAEQDLARQLSAYPYSPDNQHIR